MSDEFVLKDFLDVINDMEKEIKVKSDTLDQTLRGLVTEAVKTNETKIATRLSTTDYYYGEGIPSSIKKFLDENYKQIFSEKDYDTNLLLNDQCKEHSYIEERHNADPSERLYSSCNILDCDGQTATECKEFPETTELRTKLNREIKNYHTEIVNIREKAKTKADLIFKNNNHKKGKPMDAWLDFNLNQLKG